MDAADIALTNDGRSIIKNGDFAIDENAEVAIAQRMLRTPLGSWENDPAIGIGIQSFAGMPNNQTTAQELEETIVRGLEKVGVSAQALVYPIDKSTVAVQVTIATIIGPQTIAYSFSYMDGAFTELETPPETEIYRAPANKYDARNRR